MNAMVRLAGMALVVAVLGAAGTGGAAATEIGGRAGPVLGMTWGGVYVGGHLGFGQGRGRVADPASASPAVTTPIRGLLGGGQIGFNTQTGRLVLGIEADFSAADISGTSTVVDPGGDVGSSRPAMRWTSLVTGRVGYAVGNALVFARAGAAFGGFRYAAADLTNNVSAAASFTATGWTVGGGVELAVSEAWSVRGEYAYVNFPARRILMTDSTGATGAVSIGHQAHVVKIGVNYRFATH